MEEVTKKPYKQSRNLNRGRIVIFRTYDEVEQKFKERPAIVIGLSSYDGRPDLAVFLRSGYVMVQYGVEHSVQQYVNTWCWCDEQDFSDQSS